MDLRSDPVRWLFGDALERRLQFEQSDARVIPSRLARRLSDTSLRLKWDGWIAAYRERLLNPAEAVSKAAEDIQIQCRDFDCNLLNVFAEILAVLELSHLGAGSFTALLTRRGSHPAGMRTPDFRCLFGDTRAAVEVKTIHEHRFAERVMLEAYLDSFVRNGLKPPFALVMLPCDRRALGRNYEGEEEVRDLVARITDGEFEPQVNQTVKLPNGGVVRFRLDESGDSRDESGITLEDLLRSEILGPAIRQKIQQTAAEALKQLHADSVNDVERRILAMRWELPFYDMLRPTGIAEVLRSDLEPMLVSGDKPVEVLIFSDFGIELSTVRS